jgi:hypothetical protein
MYEALRRLFLASVRTLWAGKGRTNGPQKGTTRKHSGLCSWRCFTRAAVPSLVLFLNKTTDFGPERLPKIGLDWTQLGWIGLNWTRKK